MTNHDDRDLERAFAHLRARDEVRLPDAGEMLARARAEAERLRAEVPDRAPPDEFSSARRRRLTRWALPGLGAALAAAVAGLILLDSTADPDADFERVVEAWTATGGAWRSPTDPLLRTPGDRILRTVPRLDGLRPPAPDVETPSPEGSETLS